ncbi:leucine--tRNA ligase [Actinoplanes sp. LDG1-06]|uniref:Leucine--tRNA ligase n=1 Tax=Paractinoplanes ovalisporus TaxID=2810368 RepID=A0ABS2AG79_9ACTN|nr:leucine--tRNA ligase [Actinoplanes ovalisporus]MBM2618853.1 leucine--tRNA ligase [Actinoplanes ovalisporus]
MSDYDFEAMQRRWQPVWESLGLFTADGSGKPRRSLVDMFAYPSGDLHMGHAEAYALGDAVARFWIQQGYDVLHPVGWDAFGLPAENAAIRRGAHPAEWTYANIGTQAESFRRYATSIDWRTRLHTSDPSYYRWTQWLFLRFLERGLAVRKRAAVNWCPVDRTVLANEQVVAGRCERCGSAVTKRELTQWFLTITAYAEQLLDDMAELEGHWPAPVLTMQRNWIGRSAGAYLDFGPFEVFTTRPDTVFGATFLVVAPDSALAGSLCSAGQRPAFDAYVSRVRGESDITRTAAGRAPTGVFLGAHGRHPFTGEPLPIWAADYVLPGHGTGAIMAVPAHDERDLAFAQTFDLPVRPVAGTRDTDASPDFLAGMDREAATARLIAEAEARGVGRAGVTYRLRDWLVSRQRFWGCPIPVVHCANCGIVPVPDDQLPVVLPDLRGEALAPQDVSPLATVRDWVEVDCPRCGGPAERDTDTMDTFVDSSWYFLRYCSPAYGKGPFDPDAVGRWMPVDQYVGGAEHAVMHLLYVRFFTKVLRDLGLVDFAEPFRRLMTQGQVVLNGAAMSKSKGNMVDLGEQIDTYGVDAVRLTMVFAGPPEEDIDWADVSPAGSVRFLGRVLRLASEIGAASPAAADHAQRSTPGPTLHRGSPATSHFTELSRSSEPPSAHPVDSRELWITSGDPGLRRTTHRLLAAITELMEEQRLNVAVARAMELANAVRRAIDGGLPAGDPAAREAAEVLAVVLSLFTPYTAEEMWARLGHPPGVARAGWPRADPALVAETTVICALQVNGKLRDRLEVPADITTDDLTALALASPVAAGRTVTRLVVRPPHVVNLVVSGP